MILCCFLQEHPCAGHRRGHHAAIHRLAPSPVCCYMGPTRDDMGFVFAPAGGSLIEGRRCDLRTAGESIGPSASVLRCHLGCLQHARAQAHFSVGLRKDPCSCLAGVTGLSELFSLFPGLEKWSADRRHLPHLYTCHCCCVCSD